MRKRKTLSDIEHDKDIEIRKLEGKVTILESRLKEANNRLDEIEGEDKIFKSFDKRELQEEIAREKKFQKDIIKEMKTEAESPEGHPEEFLNAWNSWFRDSRRKVAKLKDLLGEK